MQVPAGQLLRQIQERSRSALESGALIPIETGVETISEGGVDYAVRVRKNVARKAAAPPSTKNPFLPPYEDALYVGDLGEAHVVLLNKFNVFSDHALIVTRDFEPQSSLLSIRDFDALRRALDEVEGLVFYNGGGNDSGASQPHKHLQLVPFPIVDGMSATPMETRIRSGTPPFPAAISGELTWGRYRALLDAVDRDRPGAPYNLLATQAWMMVVPRTRECFEDISVNSLGFIGSLFVKNEAQRDRVKAVGPAAVLKHVTT